MKKCGIGWVGFLLVGVLLLGSCGKIEVGIESSPQVNPTMIVTEAVVLPTASSTKAMSTATLRPTATSTATLEPTATVEPSPTFTPLAPSDPPPVPSNTAVPTPTDVPPPEIFQFSVSPQIVEPRGSLQVSWDSSGDRVEICVFQTGYSVYRECRETAVSGTLIWELDDALRDVFSVELSVSRAEQVATQGVVVDLACPPEADWWFFAPAPSGCPEADAVTTLAATQPFERGWMLWLDAEDVIYVFFDDNTFTRFYGWQLWGDTEQGDGGVVAPEGFVAPVRGFGLVWRGAATDAENGWVRDRIGWGLTTEYGFQTQYQQDAFAVFSSIYLRDADGRIIYLDPSISSWSVYQAVD